MAGGDVLSDMPVLLYPCMYIEVPLEATYLAAWDTLPRRWQDVVAPASGK